VPQVQLTGAHPRVAVALAAADLSESYARAICGWTGQLPGNCRVAADAILVTAATAGMDLRDLAALAAEILSGSNTRPPRYPSFFSYRGGRVCQAATWYLCVKPPRTCFPRIRCSARSGGLLRLKGDCQTLNGTQALGFAHPDIHPR
jgi:hypothetical protein